ncbi:MAG TPA: DUF2298 domain-containing protein [Candidatus Woesebacteria bacterium]|nr:DUF2298 domain-containing protein [Candidatus Woesebacteria bacterium]
MANGDFLIILQTYAISLGLQFLGWPWVKKFFGKMPDKGWCLSRVFVSLVSALLIWQLSYLGLPSNTQAGVWAFLVFIGLADLFLIIKEGLGAVTIPRGIAKLVSIEEYLFIIGFGGIALLRAYDPSLDSLEKYMDFGFVNQYLNSLTLPALDMWQAGQSINYYSFGHFWASILIKIWGVKAAVGYNLMLAFIFGVCVDLVFMASYMLTGKHNARASLVGGLVGALSVLLAGNSQVIWYLIENQSLSNYWYADATRFIYNTIHEFPSYSFVVSDLHGHVLDLPVILAFLIVLFVWIKDRKRVYEIIMGCLFGVMMMTNTWDVAVYGLLLIVLSAQMALSNKNNIKDILRVAMIMFVTMFAVAIPWGLKFIPISNGIGIVSARSPLWQLAALWTGGIIVSFVAVITEGKGENRHLVRTLMITALLLIAIPEFVFARDIYATYPRANTMFKLTYQAFIMMGILAGYCWGKLLDREVKMPIVWRFGAFFAVFWIFVGTMVFPFEAFPTYYGGFKNYQGLDGEKWMETKMPENYGAIKYLQENRNGKNMVEAVGESYTLQNAVSVFSGVPTIQGWRVHEWLWRGGFGVVAERQDEVTEIYQGEDLGDTAEILKKYNVGWILVGQDEKISYRINEEKLWQFGEVVWSTGETYLIKITHY